jgi:hypothetical protein
MDAEIEGELGLKVLYTPPHGAAIEYDFGYRAVLLYILISDTAL